MLATLAFESMRVRRRRVWIDVMLGRIVETRAPAAAVVSLLRVVTVHEEELLSEQDWWWSEAACVRVLVPVPGHL